MDDLISRQAAMIAVTAGSISTATVFGRTEEGMTAAKEIIRAIKSIPSAQPERKTGRWIEDHKLFGKGPTAFKCSVCGTIGIDCDDYKFCHMCGAYMGGDT